MLIVVVAANGRLLEFLSCLLIPMFEYYGLTWLSFQVLNRLDKMQEPSRAIFVACEEDMDVALAAAKRGVWTFSSDWLMSCVMRQELDFEAPQFAESL